MELDELKTLPPMDRSKWKRVRFGDVVRCVDKTCRDPESEGLTRVVGLEHLDPGELKINRWADIADGTSFTRTFRAGQVLFGKRRAYQRKAAVANFDGICSGDILVFQAVSPTLIEGLLPFVVQSPGFFEHAVKTSAGSLSPRTKWSELADFEFSLPSLPEQERLLSLLQAAEDSLSQVREVLRNVGLLERTVIERALAEHDTAWTSLASVAEVRSGLAKNSNSDFSSIMLPYISVANVQNGYLDLSEVLSIRVPEGKIDRYRLRPGDVLLTEGGDFDKVGRGAIWNGEIAECVHQNHIFCVRPTVGLLEPRWLTAQLGSPRLRSYFLNCAKKTSNLASINMTQVRACPVCVPPISKQIDIVSRLEGIYQQRSSVEVHLAKLTDLRNSLVTNHWGVGRGV